MVRKKLIQEIFKEIYGPREGVLEKFSGNPFSEYLSGVLVPSSYNEIKIEESLKDKEIDKKYLKKFPEDDDFESNLEEDYDNQLPSQLDPRFRTKSFGLSFILESENPCLDICITWARYFEENECWSRKPYYYHFRYNLDDEFPIDISDTEDGEINLYVKKVNLNSNKYRITISLVNNLNHNSKFIDVSKCIFQPSIRIVKDENSEFPDITRHKTDDELFFIHRKRPIKAIGHMCSVVWEDIDYLSEFENYLWDDGLYFINQGEDLTKFLEPHLRTEFVPIHPVPLPCFNPIKSKIFNANELSECWDNDELINYLSPLIESYENWINDVQRPQLSDLTDYGDVPHNIIKNQECALNRIKSGIRVLIDDENAKLAFCFANKAIDLQYKWKVNKSKNCDDDFKWRVFQLAFFLMSIESIVKKESKFRKVLDLLWISTGGGKTEAYLGIMAFTIAYRRLTKSNSGGVSILSRYTLRLLTIQQFRRTLSLITACEYLRVFPYENFSGWRPKECHLETDWLYGKIRFSIGMWVGSKVTPNFLRGDGGALDLLDKYSLAQNDGIDDGNPAQVMRCPACGNWISIPSGGLPKSEDTAIHIILKKGHLFKKEKFKKSINELTFVKKVSFSDENHSTDFFTLSIYFQEEEILEKHFENIFDKFDEQGIEIASLNKYQLGYFKTVEEINRQNNTKDVDFGIFCTNPSCDLNSNVSWDESPIDNYDDSMRVGKILPFNIESRIPIPAYTVDEQIYCRLPTIIISTVDKIAQLPFEPLISSIFGNVSIYNKYYGYCRDEESLNNLKNVSSDSLNEIRTIDSFPSIDLIIQDELHLIDGPLGSLFGLYEIAISSLIEENGGNPKYIASSATIKNAKNQCNLLFARDTFQFPPHGLDIEDNFFVKEQSFQNAWDEKNSGRIYLGVYSPGRGPMTPQVRLWANLLNNVYENKNYEFIKYYWTLVGYYNAMRELGGGLSLYREDIPERLKEFSQRDLKNGSIIELSSRIPSTEIPLELNKLELDGLNNIPNFNAIFTTSMFGTGVDVSHLSLMIVNGQPKTTGTYIQTTGRIGRDRGGLVLTFFKAGRARDLNHYESFSTYHYNLQLGVEPVSVSPFSKGTLDIAAAAILVGFLRNSRNLSSKWSGDSANCILDDGDVGLNNFLQMLTKRLDHIGVINANSITEYIESQEHRWFNMVSKDEYKFKEKLHPRSTSNLRYNVLLGDSAHEYDKDLKVIFKNIPNSLRNIEDSTGFWV